MSASNRYLQLNVGGIPYFVDRTVLLKYPESFFAKLITSPFKETTNPLITINQDGDLFRYVYEYMCYGQFPRRENGTTFLDVDELSLLEVEAEFYQLPELKRECEIMQTTGPIQHHVKFYKSVRKQIDSVNAHVFRDEAVVFRGRTDPPRDDEFELNPFFNKQLDKKDLDKQRKEDANLFSLLALVKAGQPWITGTIPENCDTTIFKSSTIRSVNVYELLYEATPSPFGHGMYTCYNSAVRDSMEISASKLEDLSGIINNFDIAALAPNRQLVLKPYKLVIYKEGGHFDEHRDTVRGENHIGTLVLVLHSNYTGGELVLDHGSHSVSVTGGGNWVAMYGDVIHRIQPVTSGTRVSLIFDILSYPLTLNSTMLSDPSNFSNMVPSIESRVYEELYEAIEKHFEKYKKIIISLSHLYPSCQADADFLKGDDQVLYTVLVKRYKTETTSILVDCYLDYYEEKVVSMDFKEYRFPLDEQTGPPSNTDGLRDCDSVLFVPKSMNKSSVVHYDPKVEYTGNEAAGERTIYLVTALVLQKETEG